ncbi:MAG: tail fiber protein [Acidimicrobiia bacterium]|nr:tail fiber protein [Acidimicrobiia bacterium]
MDPLLGQIVLFAGNFAPRGWALCEGQLLPISSNSALFSILGTMYGGDGRVTFALPDLRGRAPIGVGTGPGLSPVQDGQQVGAEHVTLTTAHLPAHDHGIQAASGERTTNRPGGAVAARGGAYAVTVPDAALAPTLPSGGGQPFPNLQPSLGLRFIIAVQGIYPSRP